MRNLLLAAMITMIIFVSGCTSQGIAIETVSTDKAVYHSSIETVSTDKAVYHSSDIMNLSVQLYAEAPLNVTVAVNGIDNRFNVEKEVSLKKGDNEVSFTYTLPRCNVCGGIRAGDYNLSFTVRYKNLTIEDSTIINIQQ